jgi:hypothetical protein
MNPRDDVILSYGHLAPETTSSGQVCPKCNGGNHQERSLSVGRTGAVLWWRCHRASCAFRGSDTAKGGGATTHDERKGVVRQFARSAIPAALKAKLSEMYRIDGETMDRARWSYTGDYDGYGARVIFPIFSPTGLQRGEQFRSYSGHQPKAFTNGDLATNLVSWYRFRKYAKVLVIVEDIPSAVRIAETERVDSLALLGTILNFDRVAEIRDEEYTRVWLSLDRDATNQAIKMKREFDKYLPALMIKPLGDDDVKDMSPQQFDLFIEEVVK